MNCLSVYSSPLAKTETLALIQMFVLYKTNPISLDQRIFNYIYKAKHTQQDHLFVPSEIHGGDFDLIQMARDCGAGCPNC